MAGLTGAAKLEWLHRGAAILLSLLTPLPGCQLPRKASAPAEPVSGLDVVSDPALLDGAPMAADSHRPSELEPDPRAVRIQMQFDVLRVELPVQSDRPSTELWKHVDETRLDPRLTEHLARNGLRVGVATPDAWPAIRELFESRRSRSLRAVHAVEPGAPLSLRLGEVVAGEPIFVRGRDGALSGASFESGTKFLHVDYALDRDDPRRTHLKITPEIQKFSETRHWDIVDGAFREAPRYEGRTFDELSTELFLGTDEFLVYGLGEEANLKPLLGSRFLQREENNILYETVVCVTPKPVRLDLAGR